MFVEAKHGWPAKLRHREPVFGGRETLEATEASTAIVAEVIIEATAETIAAALILSARAVIGRGIAERVGAALILPSWTVKCRRVAEGIGAAQILPIGTIERPVLGQGCRRRQRKGNKRKCDQLHVYLPCLTGCIVLSLGVDAAAKRAAAAMIENAHPSLRLPLNRTHLCFKIAL